LGDIQDHIVTMTANLGHYESVLRGAHSNYLAQIQIRMGERSDLANDSLNKLTVLGTVVLPMNFVTGLFGMNTRVPGEQGDPGDLRWFWGLTCGMITCAFFCFVIAQKVFLRQ